MYEGRAKLLRARDPGQGGLRPGGVVYVVVKSVCVINVTSERSKRSKESTWKYELSLKFHFDVDT